MSVNLDDIIHTYIPGGLPNKEEIEEMTQEERDELFAKQAQIISHYRRITVAELLNYEVKMSKMQRVLNGEIKPEKIAANEQIGNIKENRKAITESINSIFGELERLKCSE